MYVIPAIDLLKGKCARLIQGDYNRRINYHDDPVAQARQFIGDGAAWLHIIDLDGAKVGRPVNTDAIAAIVALGKLKIEVGGGLRDEESIKKLLDMGVERVIVGTKAVNDFDWFTEITRKFTGKIVLSLDTRGSKVATHGWTQSSSQYLIEFAEQAAKLPLAAIILMANFALIPPSKADDQIELAVKDYGNAHELLTLAAEYDRFDPRPLTLDASLYLQQYRKTSPPDEQLLKNAAESLGAAIGRDKASYKSYDKLSDIYKLLADNYDTEVRKVYLEKAFIYVSLALDRYPGSGRINFKAAEFADQLGKKDIALNYYRKTVEIEDAYRRQFKIMYPGREIFSRLGQRDYQTAKQKIAELTTG